LKLFKSKEIEEIVCGNSDDSEWTMENLLQFTVPQHGYHSKSSSYKNLLLYMTELTRLERKEFLKFITGSSRLPFGGF
jgi:E3 ubiquitin-protein ligase TRIP12